MDYAAAVAALRSRGRFGVNLGLERIDAILDELDHPERRLRGALIGGTNGKGSVVAMLGSMLNAAGLRVGSMPKPHLVSYRERIALDAQPLSEERFAAAVLRVLPAVDRVAARAGAPTEFEALTAAAFAELADTGVDVALVEVGMGGRLDATNAADLGVAAITNVQLDHERYLGRTLGLIATEKAAIIKVGDHAVTGASGHGLAPIVDRCAALAVPLLRCGPRQPYSARVRDLGWDGLLADATTPRGELRDLRIGLLGRHQAANAAVALATLDALRDAHGLRVPEDAVRRGLAAARWAGRLELVAVPRLGGRVLLDGAHNPAGARALATALRDLGVEGSPLVFGAMRGKRVDAVLRALAGVQPRPIFTRVADPAAFPADELARRWERISSQAALTAPDVDGALRLAAEMRRDDQPIVVAGSLYLVGEARGLLIGEDDSA
jgi:dihydrofolate synthase/folylpolyglutamate synthase